MTSQMHPVDRIRTRVVAELPLYIREWERSVCTMDAPGWGVSESFLVNLVGLAQITRGMVRLLLLPLSEVCALCMEALLTFSLCGTARYDPPLHALMRRGCHCLHKVFALCTERVDMSPETVDSLRRELFDVARLLQLHMEESVRRAYDGPCVVYPVRRGDGHDPAPLRVRGFDLLRVEREGLNMYLLDYDWTDVVERGSGVGGLLWFLARNGHVFDVRSVPGKGEEDAMLRLVFASPLDQDFVEAVTRIPSERVHVINGTRIRRYEPSWQGRQALAVTRNEGSSLQRLDELVAAYDAAMATLFATARAEHNTAVHASSPPFGGPALSGQASRLTLKTPSVHAGHTVHGIHVAHPIQPAQAVPTQAVETAQAVQPVQAVQAIQVDITASDAVT